MVEHLSLRPDVRVISHDLREVAETWWEVDRDPVVVCDPTGRTFWLLDPEAIDDPERRLTLVTFASPVEDPQAIAAVLAEGLAACDFPPTGTGAGPDKVAAALRAARAAVPPLADAPPPS